MLTDPTNPHFSQNNFITQPDFYSHLSHHKYGAFISHKEAIRNLRKDHKTVTRTMCIAAVF